MIEEIKIKDMLRLSKKIEYAILAVQYMALNDGRPVSAKEISERLNISFEFLSKTLQTLLRRGIVVSHRGFKGGYLLTRKPEETSVDDIIRAAEEKTELVECFEHAGAENCGRADTCTLRSPMGKMTREINGIFKSTTVADLIADREEITNYNHKTAEGL